MAVGDGPSVPLALGGAPSDPSDFELHPCDEAGEKDRIETCPARAVRVGGGLAWTKLGTAFGLTGATLESSVIARMFSGHDARGVNARRHVP